LLGGYWLDASGAPEHPASKISPARSLRRIGVACVAALLVSHLVRPWFAGASMSGSSSFAKNLALIPDVLSSTHQGTVWYLNSVALLALLGATFFAAPRQRALVLWPFLVPLVLIACAKAASGHASNQGDFTLAELSMLLHILGIGVWSGTVIASGLVVLPNLAQFSDCTVLWNYGRLLSRTVTWALGAILLSGAYTSYRELNGTLSGLLHSGWGRVLLVKLAFVSLALILGALSRFRCVQRPATDQKAVLLVRLVRTEAVVMILILCLSGLLANTPPAMTEASSGRIERCHVYSARIAVVGSMLTARHAGNRLPASVITKHKTMELKKAVASAGCTPASSARKPSPAA
jgi:putative copper resistance protein D